MKTAQVRFRLFSMSSFVFDSLMALSIYFANWSGHQGPLICVVESKLPINLLHYGCVLDLFDLSTNS